jgi:mRNA (2'-O-methyladenosine-N6-)-methyltransferase
VIVEEEFTMGSTEKPEEIYSMIERFCLGRRRIELFGETHNIRDGW